ncbi:type IIL restriction-modification enzyme MmeI, partial [Staphylococcus saprophyticus]|uniref:type IIL restriction-modification enzyme MmeI n=1 Tax=Staphylococcus saprophyticus TaxID=29385 RepID=UPI003704699B
MKQIIIPPLSSQSPHYLPIPYLNNNTLISHSPILIYNPPISLLRLLQSPIHILSLRSIRR